MLQSLKKYFPWVLVIIPLVILLWKPKENNNESTIESQLKVEESLVDSFLSVREDIIQKRDSSLRNIDTLEVNGLMLVLRENINWYENKNVNSWDIPMDWDSTCITPRN